MTCFATRFGLVLCGVRIEPPKRIFGGAREQAVFLPTEKSPAGS